MVPLISQKHVTLAFEGECLTKLFRGRRWCQRRWLGFDKTVFEAHALQETDFDWKVQVVHEAHALQILQLKCASKGWDDAKNVGFKKSPCCRSSNKGEFKPMRCLKGAISQGDHLFTMVMGLVDKLPTKAIPMCGKKLRNPKNYGEMADTVLISDNTDHRIHVYKQEDKDSKRILIKITIFVHITFLDH